MLIATGRVSNADRLKPENTGVQLDKRGWIVVDKFLETTKPGIYAMGDATGRYMFKHKANYEADLVSDNMLKGKERERHARGAPCGIHASAGGQRRPDRGGGI